MKININDILEKKRLGRKITMLTAYDYPLAEQIDKAGIDMILVGDSVANVVLGLESTTQVGMQEMIHHAKAAARAVKRALLIGDMPYEAYQLDPSLAVKNARRFIDEAGCDAVKLEWFDKCLEVTKAVTGQGIAVMGHIGLTPQTAGKLGGFKVQGKDSESALRLIKQALELEKTGCFSLVLECVPDRIARVISGKLRIPTIGIGAGIYCDGQVLVTHDMLGLLQRKPFKFVQKYADLYPVIEEAVKKYKEDVENRVFPAPENAFSIKEEELDKIIHETEAD